MEVNKMNFRNIVATKENEAPAKRTVKKKTKGYFNSLEYELISGLVLQQYAKDDAIQFDLLLAIPAEDRIPALAKAFGNKRMHQLLVMIIKAFVYALPIPKYKKLTDTKISVCACDILLAAEEDQLSMEDIIIFFESARKGKYGTLNSLLHHAQIMSMLQTYRQDRHRVYQQIMEKKEAQLKQIGPLERTCSEPKKIGDLFNGATVIDMTQKMSG